VWRLYQPLKWFWGVALVGVATSLSATALDKILFGSNLYITQWGWVYIYHYGVWIGLITTCFVALTLAAVRSHRERDVEKRRFKEFLRCKPTSELLPADFGYQSLNLGEEPNPHYRPYHQIYIQRSFTSHDGITEDTNPTVYTEDEVRQALSKGRDVLLLGQPLEGKTRTLYEILKRMDGYTVLSPYKERDVPEDDLFSTLEGCRVVLVLDDLNEYATARIDLQEFCHKLDRNAEFWVIAGTCRTGPEMGLLNNVYGKNLARVNESIALKLSPRPLSSEEMARLGEATNPKWFPDLNERGDKMFPTPGIVTMSYSMTAMRHRFDRLQPEQKDLLRALQLLFIGMQPFPIDLIKVVLKEIFDREIPNFNDCLDALGEYAFLRRPARQDPVSPELAYIVGAVRYMEGRGLRDDLMLLMNILISRGDADGLFRLGLTYVELADDRERALRCFDASLQLNSEAYYVLLEKGNSLNKLGRIEEAVEAFGRATTIEPNKSNAWIRRGIALYSLHHYDEALTDISRALESKVDDTQLEAALWSLKATSLNHLTQYVEALESAEKAIYLRPDQSSYWAEKGAILHNLHRYQEAVDAYQKALELNPGAFETSIHASLALSELNRWQEGVDLLDRALRINPDNPKLWAQKGSCLANVQLYDEALEAFDRSLELCPDERSVWRAKGMIYSNLDRYEEALVAFDRALGLEGTMHPPEAMTGKEIPITPSSLLSIRDKTK
jgi:tetratricopeptide (TPR) repeat protein